MAESNLEIVRSNGQWYVMKGDRIVYGPNTREKCSQWISLFSGKGISR